MIHKLLGGITTQGTYNNNIIDKMRASVTLVNEI